jgi:hypothetical protein
MNRVFCALLALLSLCAANHCSAAVFERDWKSPGDGLLTYDDVNRREWLDVSQTILSSQFPGEDPSPWLTRENRYQYVVGQTLPRGLFEGFKVAKSPDVIGLAQSAGIDTSTLSVATNGAAALSLGQLLGFTFVGTSSSIAIGLLDEPPNDRFGATIRPGAFIASASNLAGLAIDQSHFQYPTPPGVMLYSVVPEPSSASLLMFGSIVIMLWRRRFYQRRAAV